jgi:hypothetical protein
VIVPKNRRKREISPADAVPIVGDGAMAGPVAEGAMVPVVILDTSGRPDVEELIRVHEFVDSGDVTSEWGCPKGDARTVVLVLDFSKPIEARIVLRFGTDKQAPLIDGAVSSSLIYLQSGKAGDRLKDDPARAKVLVGLGATGFRPIWDKLWLTRLTAVIGKNQKVSAARAEPVARQCIEEMRRLTEFRMPQR